MPAKVPIYGDRVVVIVSSGGPQGPQGPPGEGTGGPLSDNSLFSGFGEPSPDLGEVNDHYIDKDTSYLYGPKTEAGWGAGVPLGSGSGSGLVITDVAQTYTQSTPANIWNIVHNLQFNPNITVVDPNGEKVIGAVKYFNSNLISVEFSEPLSGWAYLS